jgi:hypothetical protein
MSSPNASLRLCFGRWTARLDIEVATAQLWVRPDKGVRTFADLKGKPIATTKKTTAHIFLNRALRANGIDSAEVEVRNSSMSEAVAAFISGEVPPSRSGWPFNVRVREKLPEAIKLVDTSAFYPQSAVVGGWVARADYHDDNKEVLVRIIRGWPRRTIIWFATAQPPPRPCTRTITPTHRLLTSARHSRRRRCIRRGSGSSFIRTERSEDGFSR